MLSLKDSCCGSRSHAVAQGLMQSLKASCRSLRLYCCFTAALLPLYCCFADALLLLYCIQTAWGSRRLRAAALRTCRPQVFFVFYCCYTAAILLLFSCYTAAVLRRALVDCSFFLAALLLLYYCFLLLYCEPLRRALADCWSFLICYYSSSLRPHTVV